MRFSLVLAIMQVSDEKGNNFTTTRQDVHTMYTQELRACKGNPIGMWTTKEFFKKANRMIQTRSFKDLKK